MWVLVFLEKLRLGFAACVGFADVAMPFRTEFHSLRLRRCKCRGRTRARVSSRSTSRAQPKTSGRPITEGHSHIITTGGEAVHARTPFGCGFAALRLCGKKGRDVNQRNL